MEIRVFIPPGLETEAEDSCASAYNYEARVKEAARKDPPEEPLTKRQFMEEKIAEYVQGFLVSSRARKKDEEKAAAVKIALAEAKGIVVR